MPTTAGGDRYRCKIPTFRSEFDRAFDANFVALGPTQSDSSDFRLKYEPGHLAADANGNVKYPNVNPMLEMTDMREAQRSYEANINVITATRRMLHAHHRHPEGMILKNGNRFSDKIVHMKKA
jgi:flagellar basal-body rod protein FlgC